VYLLICTFDVESKTFGLCTPLFEDIEVFKYPKAISI